MDAEESLDATLKNRFNACFEILTPIINDIGDRIPNAMQTQALETLRTRATELLRDANIAHYRRQITDQAKDEIMELYNTLIHRIDPILQPYIARYDDEDDEDTFEDLNPRPLPASLTIYKMQDLYDLIHGSSHTYKDLEQAFMIKTNVELAKEAKRTAEETAREPEDNCTQIHRFFKKVRDPVLGLQILRDFYIQTNFGLNPKLDYLPTESEDNDINQLMMDSINDYLSRSDIPEFKNEQSRIQMINGILRKCDSAHLLTLQDRNGDLVKVSVYSLFLFIFNFLNKHPASMQTLWADAFVRDCIEAYDVTIQTYRSGDEISCLNGIMERAIMLIGGIVATIEELGHMEQKTLRSEDARKTTARTEHENALRKESELTEKRNLIERWTREYYAVADPFTIEGLRRYIGSHLPDPLEPEWADAIDRYIEIHGEGLMLGGRIGDKRLLIFDKGKKRRKTQKRETNKRKTNKHKANKRNANKRNANKRKSRKN